MTSVPGDAMENWRVKVEPQDEEQVDITENAEPAERDWTNSEVEDGMFESVMIKLEPEVVIRESEEDGELLGSCVDVAEHPAKLDQGNTLICGLPAPDAEFSDQEQPQDIGNWNLYLTLFMFIHSTGINLNGSRDILLNIF
jgi:hypothetical protein